MHVAGDGRYPYLLALAGGGITSYAFADVNGARRDRDTTDRDAVTRLVPPTTALVALLWTNLLR